MLACAGDAGATSPALPLPALAAGGDTQGLYVQVLTALNRFGATLQTDLSQACCPDVSIECPR